MLAIDAGNYRTKVCTNNGVYSFFSDLGEHRDRQLLSKYGDDDIIYEYDGEKGFAGSLARNESEFVRNMKGDSKAHRDALIRVLIACHRYTNDTVLNVIVGQPISRHNEKNKIKEMLIGKHAIKVNGHTKTFVINKCEVAVEGASAYFVYPSNHIIDIGSGTINFATIKDKRFVDRDSFTTKDGIETLKNKDYLALAKRIETLSLDKWERTDSMLIIGGGAKFVYSHLNKVFPNCKMANLPEYANVMGYYKLGQMIYGD